MSSTARIGPFPHAVNAQPATRWAPFLAALPHLCLGTILSLDLYIRSFIAGQKTQPFFQSSNLLFIPFLVISLVIVVYAHRHSIPLWTASWDGYAIFLSTFAISLLVAALDEDSYVYQVGIIVLALLAILIGYTLRFRYAPKHALLMGMMLLPFIALIFLDTVPLFQQAIFVLGLYLLYGLLAAWVVIAPGWTAAASVAWIASLLAAGVQGVFFVAYSIAPATHLSLEAGARSAFWIQSALISAYYFAPWLLWKVRGFFVREMP